MKIGEILNSAVSQMLRSEKRGWEFVEECAELQIAQEKTSWPEFERHYREAGLWASWQRYVSWKFQHPGEPVPAEVNDIPRPSFIDHRRVVIDGERFAVYDPPFLRLTPDYVPQNMLRYGHPEVAALTNLTSLHATTCDGASGAATSDTFQREP